MFCPKCGKPNEDSGKFCKFCGSALGSQTTIETTKPIDESSPINAADPKNFSFMKAKMIGYLTYLKIETKVEIGDKTLTIRKKNKPFGIGGKDKVSTIQKSDIKGVMVRKRLDLIDGIYFIVASILTLISAVANLTSSDPNWISTLILLVVALICFYTGYGKVIEISLNNQKPIRILTQGKQNESSLENALRT